MKPIKLIISAFGPYADTMPPIEFGPFEERGLFLISGDTGAGKTTIFDAVCYALYGTASGSYRDTKNLRSEYAKPSAESFVDFYFSHQGRQYHVRREPEYLRPKQRGKGEILQQARAVFYEDGREPIEGVRQVNAAVEELLHINEKQFKQIAMIAQGEFRELLNAGTQERTEILRTIFATDAYNRIEYRLKDSMNAGEHLKENTEHSIVQYFGEVKAAESSAWREKLSELQERAGKSKSAWNIREMLEITDEIAAEDSSLEEMQRAGEEAAAKELKRLQETVTLAETTNRQVQRWKELQEEVEHLHQRKEEMEEKKRLLSRQNAAVREVLPVWQSWENKRGEIEEQLRRIADKKEELHRAKERREAAEELLAKERLRQEEAQKLQKKAERIAAEHTRYEKREEWLLGRSRLEKEQILCREKADEAAREESALKSRIAKLRAAAAEDKEKPVELERTQSRQKELETLRRTAEELCRRDIPEHHVLQKRLASAQQDFAEAFREYREAAAKRLHAEQILDSCRAGILAGRLTEGEKCPVCGSVHHPALAILPKESVTEEEVESRREQENRCSEAKNAALVASESAGTKLESFEQQLRGKMLDCIENPLAGGDGTGLGLEELERESEAAEKELQRKVEKTRKEVRELQKGCESLRNLEQALQRAEGEELREQTAKRENAAKQLEQNVRQLAETKAALQTFSDLEYDSWDAADGERQVCLAASKEILDSIDRAEKEKHAADLQAADTGAALETLEHALTIQKADEDRRKEAAEQTLREHGFASAQEMLQYAVTKEVLEESEQEIRGYEQQTAAARAALEIAAAEAEGKSVTEVQTLKEQEAEQTERLEELRRQRSETQHRIRSNKEKRENIGRQEDTLEKARKDSNVCRRLYELVKGTTGNGKITLEQYIQAAGFDGIIAAANKRLLPMSGGQYELFRQEDSVGRKTGNFLDLVVLDHYTGHRRPVGNLSGGESFQASLSLALGLSDTVAANLGGIQMDALFIDEGFGTLDRRAMDSAMEILTNLSGKGKLVGIISHREELVENIPQQIKVTRTRGGSTIRMEV